MTTLDAIFKNTLDVQMDDLIAAYKAQGMGVVAVVIAQKPDGEGTVTYNGEMAATVGMHIAGIRFAGKMLTKEYFEIHASGASTYEVPK